MEISVPILKILVINDDQASLLALRALLEVAEGQDRYQVLTAASGKEALRLVLRHDFVVILCDVNMPEMDGFETAEAIRSRPRSAEIPIIFVTAFATDELDRIKGYEQGAFDFVFTPIVPEILAAKVGIFVTLAMKNAELRRRERELRLRADQLTAMNERLNVEMTERRKVERQSGARDEFLAMLGHELRNPLSAINSAASIIGLPGVSATVRPRAMDIINRQTRHLSRIVDDLLDLSRAVSGNIFLSKTQVNFSALAVNTLETFRSTGRFERYSLDTQLDESWVNGDPTRLEQILSNLVDNALKYTQAPGRISLVIQCDDHDVILRVSDNGVGIAAELLPHVFEFFVQGDAVLERANGGLGVGLSLVRRLIEMHDGEIRVESAGVGKGTTVEVRLPRCEPVKIAPDQSQVSFSGNQQTVLLIEDNGDSREMMAEILRAHGYAVLEAADGIEGCRMAKDHLPNFALIDIGLPGIDGYEVARRLRGFEAAKGIQLIALTGYGLEEDKARVLAAGFDLHLVKPVDINYLLGILTPAQSTR